MSLVLYCGHLVLVLYQTRIIIILLLCYHIGYHEEGQNFGIVQKGKYKPASNFGFEFIAEVICEDPHSSGFLVELTPDRDEQSDAPPCTRYIYHNI